MLVKRPRGQPPAAAATESASKKAIHTRLVAILLTMRKTQPAKCAWLSKETYVLPEIVNVVYMMAFDSPCLVTPLDLVRIAQFMPNVKYRPPNFAAVTIRLHPATGMLYAAGKFVLIRTTTPYMALYYSHLYRQTIEQIPMILKNPETGALSIGKLEGRLECSRREVVNMVGSGALPQDGVHLTRLLYSDEEFINWDPGGFINLIYYSRLSDGSDFTANIASTGKIVLMGLKTKRGVYEAYKIMCHVLHDFEDPRVPLDPKERHRYRMSQLVNDARFKRAEDVQVSGFMNPDAVDFDDIELPENVADLIADLGVRTTGSAAAAAVDMQTQLKGAIFQADQQQAEPLLYVAAMRGQLDNVKYFVDQPGADFQDALWVRNQNNTNYLIMERLDAIEMKTVEHMQVLYWLKAYIANHPRAPSQ